MTERQTLDNLLRNLLSFSNAKSIKIQYDTIQYNTIQYNTIQFNTNNFIIILLLYNKLQKEENDNNKTNI